MRRLTTPREEPWLSTAGASAQDTALLAEVVELRATNEQLGRVLALAAARKARTIVRRHREELGVDYVETGLITSYRQALTSLHQAGAPLRHPGVPA